jgi:hypothetical protein
MATLLYRARSQIAAGNRVGYKLCFEFVMAEYSRENILKTKKPRLFPGGAFLFCRKAIYVPSSQELR